MTEKLSDLSADFSTRIEDQLVHLLSQILYVQPDTVDREADLNDLGLDSVLVVEFAELLQQEFGVAIPAATIYEHRSPRGIARYLSGN